MSLTPALDRSSPTARVPRAAACFSQRVAPIPIWLCPSLPISLEGCVGHFKLFPLTLSDHALALLSLYIWDLARRPLTSAGALGTHEVGLFLSCMATGGCTGLSCPPFPHVLQDLLIPFLTHYYFYSPAPKPYCFILSLWQPTVARPLALSLSSLSIWITQSHMLCLWPGPFHLLSAPFFYFSHQIQVSCLIQGLCCVASAYVSPHCFFTSLHQWASWPCPPHCPSSCLSPPQVSCPSVSSICLFPPELPPNLPVVFSHTNEQFSGLFFSPRNPFYFFLKKSLKDCEALTKQTCFINIIIINYHFTSKCLLGSKLEGLILDALSSSSGNNCLQDLPHPPQDCELCRVGTISLICLQKGMHNCDKEPMWCIIIS